MLKPAMCKSDIIPSSLFKEVLFYHWDITSNNYIIAYLVSQYLPVDLTGASAFILSTVLVVVTLPSRALFE